jgi:malonate transporter and related proteins
MVGVLIGFAIIAFVVAVGYGIGRSGILGAGAVATLSRLAFFVLNPALLFTVLAEADLDSLFSELLPTAVIVASINLAAFAVIALVAWRRPVPEATIGALAAAYSNATNMGVPISAYVLGDVSTSAPVILFQLIVVSPIALTVLDLSTSGTISVGRILLQPVRNPLIIASALGLVVALTGLQIPDDVMRPFELIGGAAVPVILIAFGMSLHGQRPLAAGSDRRGIVLATTLKMGLMPMAAWVFGRFVFGLEGHALFAAVALAALPAGQNVFNFAQRYGRGEGLARDVVLLTTALSLPALLVVAALLAPT